MGGLRSVAGAARPSVLRPPAEVRAGVGGGASAPLAARARRSCARVHEDDRVRVNAHSRLFSCAREANPSSERPLCHAFALRCSRRSEPKGRAPRIAIRNTSAQPRATRGAATKRAALRRAVSHAAAQPRVDVCAISCVVIVVIFAVAVDFAIAIARGARMCKRHFSKHPKVAILQRGFRHPSQAYHKSLKSLPFQSYIMFARLDLRCLNEF